MCTGALDVLGNIEGTGPRRPAVRSCLAGGAGARGCKAHFEIYFNGATTNSRALLGL